VSGKGLNETQLYDYSRFAIRNQIAVVKGAVIPPPFGGKYRQAMVYVDPQKLYSRQLSVSDVVDALMRLPRVAVAAGRVVNIGSQEEVSMRALAERDTKNAQHDLGSAPVFHGTAADTDIIVASAKAYIKAINRMLVAFDSRPASERVTAQASARAAAAQGGRS